jgi:hypothetical protein
LAALAIAAASVLGAVAPALLPPPLLLLLDVLALAAASNHWEAMLATAAPDMTLAGTASTPMYLMKAPRKCSTNKGDDVVKSVRCEGWGFAVFLSLARVKSTGLCFSIGSWRASMHAKPRITNTMARNE